MGKIMIVICDETIADFLAKLMMIYRHEPLVVRDSTRVIAVANATDPDVILLDFMMPDVSGLELCRLLRTDQRFAQVPIVIVSAGESAENRDKAFQAGANDYITMPFDYDDLRQRINALIS